MTALRFSFLLLLSCQTKGGYDLRYPPELRGGIAAMDAGVDCLVARIEEQGLLTPSVAARLIKKAHLEVRTFQEPIETSDPNVRLSGMHSPDGIVWFLWAPGTPLPETSFQHELVHAILCSAQGPGYGPDCWGDAQHQAKAWWLPVIPAAKQCWREWLAAQETSAP